MGQPAASQTGRSWSKSRASREYLVQITCYLGPGITAEVRALDIKWFNGPHNFCSYAFALCGESTSGADWYVGGWNVERR